MKRLLLLLSPLLFLGCAQKTIAPIEVRPNTAPLSSEVSEITFYRGEGKNNIASTVWLNNHMVGSLLPQRFAQTTACKGMATVGLSGVYDQDQTLHNHPPIAVKGSSRLYFKVVEDTSGMFSLMQVEEKGAQAELAKFDAGSHIINRYIPDCTPPAPVPVVVEKPVVIEKLVMSSPVVLEKINLQSGALFAWDSFELKPEGRSALNALVQTIQAKKLNIDTIRIVGHTDRLGSEQYNMILSQKRAQSVAEHLKSQRLSVPMEVIGRGSTEPVTIACNSKKSQKLIQCLEPDRRVTIDLIGQQTITH